MTNNSEKTFEEKLTELETIVKKLEDGNIPLEESLDQFQKGIQLSKELKSTLVEAEEVLTKVIDENGSETILED